MPSSPYKELWNEFDWEKEMRKDDDRVHSYFEELPKFIDLPQEDAVILKRIQRHEELIPHGGEWPRFPENPPPNDEDSPRESFDEWARRDGSEIYLVCERVARETAILFAVDGALSRTPELMRLLCLLGKIMARSSDIVDLEPDEYPPLKIALCKRVAADLNTLLGMFLSVQEKAQSAEIAAQFDFLSAQLRILHEHVLDLLMKFRQPSAGRDFSQPDPEPDGV